jgi:hypothetical protein
MMDVVTLTETDIDLLLDYLGIRWIDDIAAPIRQLDVAVDDIDQAFKVKVNGGTWSPPLGTMAGQL